ncbi:Peroxiredoxin-1 [Gigaspora margarita]|uniref:thioredoxin-dependent peroxiredoxin n=1 Tax=Gigaspora margarita TaxID=4874 RepID=A0A8H3XCT4_GIGMA|nr:Peroxiredoxin-1 [Gigaspora margarita]
MSAKVRSPAPAFTATAVIDGQFKKVSLSDYSGQFVVLFFYPMDFTLVCPTEIIAFSDRINEFKKLNTSVLGVSCDSQFVHLAWVNTPRNKGGLGPMNIPLVADKNQAIAKSYGVLIEEEGIPLRGLFIIDDKGIVRQITVNDLPVGRNVDEIIRLIEAIQFTDKHGEVCPIGWKKGDKAINPDKAQDYFSESYKE